MFKDFLGGALQLLNSFGAAPAFWGDNTELAAASGARHGRGSAPRTGRIGVAEQRKAATAGTEPRCVVSSADIHCLAPVQKQQWDFVLDLRHVAPPSLALGCPTESAGIERRPPAGRQLLALV